MASGMKKTICIISYETGFTAIPTVLKQYLPQINAGDIIPGVLFSFQNTFGSER